MSETSEGTAVAPRKPPSTEEIAELKRRGSLAVERKEQLKELSGIIKGLEFGSVSGHQMSAQTRWQVAEFCRVTGADPLHHIDVLGGQIYTNADYWSDVVNTHPRFWDYRQRNISPGIEDELREQAAEKEKLSEEVTENAERLEDGSLKSRASRLYRDAVDLREEASDIPARRSHWGVPDWATHAYETTIVRLINTAPLEEIKAGETDYQPWLKEVTECNWAGGRKGQDGSKDPIGDNEPAKTARTRSFRRAAVRAFPGWMDEYSEQVERAERAINEDFRMLEAQEVPSEDVGERAALTGSGEPERAPSEGARELPTENGGPQEEVERSGADETSEADAASPGEPSDDEPDEAELIDRERRAYFANLRDGPGITSDEDRYTWQADHDLPKSTREWTLGQWRTANQILTSEIRREYRSACEALDIDPQDFAEGHLERRAYMISDYEALLEKLESTPVGEEAGDEDPSLDL